MLTLIMFDSYSLRVHFISDAHFQRLINNDDEGAVATGGRIIGYFHSPPVVVSFTEPLNFDQLIRHFNERVEQFTQRGSGYVLSSVNKLTMISVPFLPLGGGSYIPTPTHIAYKMAVINVKTYERNDCFRWAILSALYPAREHSDRLSSYARHEHAIDCSGLTFPTHPSQIKIFERNNPTIAIHCIAYNDKKDSFSILYLSPHMHQRPHKISLLLLDDPTGSGCKHYVWIKNLSRLIASKYTHAHARHVCMSCLQSFTTASVLNEHEHYCLMHQPQQCIYPTGDEAKLAFTRRQYQFLYDFYLVADFECFLVPSLDDDTTMHVPSAYCVYLVTPHERYRMPPHAHVNTADDDDVMSSFFRHVFDMSKTIDNILSHEVPIQALTDDERREFDRAVVCHNCGEKFSEQNVKTHHHNHVSGRYLFPACNSCNLALKPRKTSVSTGNSNSYLLPIIFHNLTAYDGHFILKFFKKEYAQYTTKDGKVHYADIGVIPLNAEKCMSLRIGNLQFIDSFQFMASSLDRLCKTMRKEGVDDFVHTSHYFGQDDIFYEKGIYPYDYVSGPSKLDETALPPKEAFYNSITEENISDEQYARAQEMWQRLSMNTLRDYTRHYIQLDVLILADLFEKFRRTMFDAHGLDCLHFPSLPSLTLQLALKMTSVKLDLIDDSEIYLMIESAIRGGLSYVAQRHAKANYPAMGAMEYRADLPTSHILYLDCNSLYATCQQFPLPVGDFRLLSDDELSRFNVTAIAADSPIGYIVECDLEYPAHLHDLHNAYPLAPEHLCIDENMLSDTHKLMLGATECRHLKCTKLVSNLRDKSHYVTHYRCLQFYLNHGLILTQIHRVVAFTQRPFMLPFVAYCNEQRKNAKSEFESDLYKLLANSFYGKTCENVRRRCNIRLIADEKKFIRAVGKANYKRSQIINDDLVMVEAAKNRILMCKPIAIGCCILEFAKLVMYQFYYDCLLPKFGDRMRLCFTDTDSLICHIESENLDGELHDIANEWLDTSNFDQEHPLYSTTNQCKLGKFKSETGSRLPLEFVGLRSKMYSLDTPEGTRSFRKAKGVPKTYVKNKVRHEQYVDVLNHWKRTSCDFRAFRSKRHRVVTHHLYKVCLSCVDDKRYLLEDSVHSLAYGHYAITAGGDTAVPREGGKEMAV